MDWQDLEFDDSCLVPYSLQSHGRTRSHAADVIEQPLSAQQTLRVVRRRQRPQEEEVEEDDHEDEEAEAVVEESEGLQLHLSAKSATGYLGVFRHGSGFQAQHRKGNANIYLGTFATAREAAVAFANHVRSAEMVEGEEEEEAEEAVGGEAVVEEAVVQEAEGVRLHMSSKSATGYLGVYKNRSRFTARCYRAGLPS